MQYIQYGENNPELRRVYFHLVDATDGMTPEAGEAGGQPTISVNGRTPTNTVNTLVAVDASKGDYYLTLATTELVNPAHLLLHYKSANTAHFAQQVQIMAFDPYTQFGTLNSGGGADVDYKRIQKLINEAVGTIAIPEQKEPDLVPISEGLQAVLTEIRGIDIPKPEKTDLEPVLSKLEPVMTELEGLQEAIRAIKMPETDLSGIENALADLTGMLEEIQIKVGDVKDYQIGNIREFFEADIDVIKTKISEVREEFTKYPRLRLSTKQNDS